MTVDRYPLPTLQEKEKCYDNTKVSTFKTCPRSYFLRHVLGWRASGIGVALKFGLAWHDAQDIVWGAPPRLLEKGVDFSKYDIADLAFEAFKKTWVREGMPLEIPLEQEFRYAPRTPSTAAEMLINYCEQRWNMITGCKIVAIEQPFAVPMPGLNGHWYIGRLDKVVDWNGLRTVLEHKSTTAYQINGNFRWDYVESWNMSSQVKGYEFGANLYYGNIDAVWVDAALVHKKVHDAFKFIPVTHHFTLIQEWLDNAREWIRQISYEEEDFKSNGLHSAIFRRNEESCYGKFGPCQFLDICRGYPDKNLPEQPPAGYILDIWEPFDLLGLEKLIKERDNAEA